MKHILIVILMVFCSSCSDDNCDQDYGTSFAVEVGETYCFPDGATLEIVSITNSYCPCDVQCVWQGEANVEGIFTGADNASENFRLHEEMTGSNPSWGRISMVTASEDCMPVIETIEIIISAH